MCMQTEGDAHTSYPLKPIGVDFDDRFLAPIGRRERPVSLSELGVFGSDPNSFEETIWIGFQADL